jgi:hypothetical protein
MRFNFSQVTYCKLFNEMLVVNSQLPAKILQFFHFITIHPKKLKNREKKVISGKMWYALFLPCTPVLFRKSGKSLNFSFALSEKSRAKKPTK